MKSYRELLWTFGRQPTTEEEQTAMDRLSLATGVVDAIIATYRLKLCATFTADEIWRMAAARWSTAFSGWEFAGNVVFEGRVGMSIIAAGLKDVVAYGELGADERDAETMRKLAELSQTEIIALNLMLQDVRENKERAEWSFQFLDASKEVGVR